MKKGGGKAMENRRRRQDLGVEELPLETKETRSLQEVKATVQRDKGDIASLQAMARATAQESTMRTQNMVKLTTEARDAGAATAAELDKQSRQLEKIDNDIEEVHDLIDRGEKTVNKMTRKWFSRSSRAKTSRNGGGKITELKDDGVEILSSSTTSRADADNKAQLLNSKNPDGTPKKRSNRPRRTGPDAELHEELDRAEDAQDEQLDQISGMLKEMKGIATNMDNELKYQNQLIDKVQVGADSAAIRMETNNQKLKRII